MSLDLKRQLVAQIVESSRLLRNYIDHRAKGRGTTRASGSYCSIAAAGGLSQVDLAEVLELQPISLVRLLDRLVEQSSRATARSQGSARQPAVPHGEGPPTGRRSRRFARFHCNRRAAGYPCRHHPNQSPNAPRHQGSDQGRCHAPGPYRGQVMWIRLQRGAITPKRPN
jgi:hypothetical protein